MRRSGIGVFVLTALVAVAGAARAAEFADLISGKVVPLSLTLKELTPEWRRLSLGDAGDGGGGAAGMYAALLGGASAQAYYTKGQTVACGDQTFIVAYKVPAAALDFAAIMQMQRGSKPPEPEPLTPDTTLSLALLHLQTLGTLTGIRPFDLARELADGAQAQERSHAMAEAMGGGRAKAQSIASMSHLKQLGLGLVMYVQDHRNFLPPLTDAAAVREAIKAYINNDAVFVHPQSKEPYRPNPSLSGKSLAGLDVSKTVVIYEASAAEDGGRAVLFLDGHVEQVSAARWTELQKASGIP